MRVLPARRLAVSALCATLLLGVTGPVALAADAEPTRDRARSAAPVPGADALLTQLKGLGDLSGVLKPVTDLLDAVLKADNGQLSAEQAAELGKAVRDAIAKAKAEAPETSPVAPPAVSPAVPPVALPVDPAAPAVPVAPPAPALPVTPPAATTPMVPAVPSAPAVPSVPAAPSAPARPSVPAAPSVPPAPQQAVTLPAFDRGLARPVGKLMADPVADALTALQKAVDALLKAATAGDLAQVPPAVTGVVAGLVKLVAATLLGSGLPAPAGLPPVQPPAAELPAVELPAAELPATPAADALPARPPVALPAR
ncbi:hypothetical protein ABT147_26935 [Streptomyces sp. NPDC001868]|uniref:hypothetical protein n=1 Tax=Streptomyces sp. NPDC001868 TaxID=3154401 RepID=UPI00332E1216